MKKRIYRSHEAKVISGVCGGIGEYFDIDPTWVRILFVLSVFANGLGLIAYLIAWIVIPARPLPIPGAESADQGDVHSVPNGGYYNNHRQHGAGFWPGIILICLGFIFLANHLFYWFRFEHIWPVILVAMGVVLIIRAMNPGGAKTESNAVSDMSNGEVANEGR